MNHKSSKITEITDFRIIKWYELEDIDASIHGSTLIFAKNKTGKSTVIDAIMYVLTGTKRFNRAANAHDERNLIGYVRKKVNGKYQRKGFVTSNIAVEITKANGEVLTIGVVLESKNETDDVISTWYFINKKISDITFYGYEENKKIVLNKNEFKKANNIDTKNYLTKGSTSLTEIRRHITYELNVRDTQKFISDLEKSAAFIPTKNVKDLLNTILHAEPIVVTNLASTIANLTNLKIQYEEIRKAISHFMEIETVGEKYLSSRNKYRTRECIIDFANISIAKTKIEKNEQLKKYLNTKIEELRAKVEKIKEEKFTVNSELIALNEDGIGETKNQLDNIERQLRECERIIREETSKVETSIYEKNKLLKAYEQCKNTNISFILPQEIGLIGEQKIDADDIQKKLIDIENEIKILSRDLHTTRNEKDKEYQKILHQINKNKSELRDVKNGLNSYPPEVRTLKIKIEEEFRKNNIKSEVKILCDMVEDITNVEWSKAIETFLGNLRYALIVEPAYLKMAQQIQKDLGSYGTNFIATNELIKDCDINERSAFAILEISNIYAKRFLAYKLNNLILCENLDELNSVQHGITKDVQIKGSYITSYKKPVKDFCLGRKAKENRAKKLEEEINELEAKKLEKKNEVDFYINIINIFDTLAVHKINPYSYNNLIDEQSKKKNLENEKYKLENNPDMIEFLNKRDRLNKKIIELENKNNQAIAEISQCEQKIKLAEKTIEENTKNLPYLEKNLNAKLDNYGFNYNAINESYQNEIKKKDPEQIIQTTTLSQYETELKSNETKLRQAMSRYQRELSDYSIPAEIEEYDKYMTKYNEFKNTQIEKVQAEIEHKIEECANIFKNELMTGLNNKITDAKKQISILNRNIKESFTEIEDYEYYQIELIPTQDRDLREIYDIVMNVKSTGLPLFDLMNSSLDLVDQKIKELINNLAKDDIDALEVFQEKICDYRNYFDCDILTINEKTGEKISMIAKGNTTSGMETQAPYYIIIAISIIKNLRNESNLRLMIMDEACDKMDTQNIMKVLNFLKSQRIQTILAAPPEKIACFENFVETTVPLIRANNDIIVVGEIQYAKENE